VPSVPRAAHPEDIPSAFRALSGRGPGPPARGVRRRRRTVQV